MKINKMDLTFPINHCEELEKIVEKNATKIIIPEKKVFMVPEEDFECIYFIKEGKTKHYMSNSEGIEKVLYILTRGWFFGEVANVLGNKRTSLYSTAEVRTVLYRIDSEKVNKLLDESKVFRDAILRCFAWKTIVLRYEIDNLIFNSCKDRIKRLLCSNVDKDKTYDFDWYNLKVRYTHYEIGVIVGSSRVTVSKLIKQLSDEGFIRIINQKIQVNTYMYNEYINKHID